jgi:antitoxin HicB
MPLSYAASITADGDGFGVAFRDVPEAITCGATFEEAIEMAADALVTSFEFYVEDRRPLPPPSAMLPGEVLITLSAIRT